MKTLKNKILIAFLALGVFGCDIVDPDRINDPNNPSVDGVLQGATKPQLQNLVTGLEF